MKTLFTTGKEKKKFIEKAVLPVLGIDPDLWGTLPDELAACLRHDACRKLDDLEQPGPSGEGRAWLSELPLIHTYYYSTGDLKDRGIAIYTRHSWVLDTASLLHGTGRSAYLQLLESGNVYSCAYGDLHRLMALHPVFKAAVERLHVEHEQAKHAHELFLLRDTIDRAKVFRTQHAAILHRIPKHVHAMHIKISKEHYYYLMRLGLVE